MPEGKHKAHCQFWVLNPGYQCWCASPPNMHLIPLLQEAPPNKAQSSAPHAVYTAPQGLTSCSACSASMFGYPIGAHDGLPSEVGISGPMGGENTGSGRGSLP